jgi:DNA-binding MarR family transcriptional regulator
MAFDAPLGTEMCNCFAIRSAARHVTQFYDQFLAPAGLRSTQYAILAKLEREGPLLIHTLAKALVMDRTTLGRNILPLGRDGSIRIEAAPSDRRTKQLHLTGSGARRLKTARRGWSEAQARFEAGVGPAHAAELRALLGSVVANAFGRPREPAISATEPKAKDTGRDRGRQGKPSASRTDKRQVPMAEGGR